MSTAVRMSRIKKRYFNRVYLKKMPVEEWTLPKGWHTSDSGTKFGTDIDFGWHLSST